MAKREVYEAYVAFCESANLQPTNDATFGKIFRATFPNVQVRRLVRRVKAKKWHYCEVAYRPGSSLAAAAETAGQLPIDAPLAQPANGAASTTATKKRKRSSNDQGEAEEDSKREGDEEQEDDGQTVLRQRKSPRKEERHNVNTIKEERSLGPAGTSSSDNEASDEDQEEDPTGRKTSYDDSGRIHAGAGVDNKSSSAELGDSGTWRRELDQGLLSSGSTASTFSSLLHSSSGFSLRPNITESDRMLLAGSGAFAFGPARKRPGLGESLIDHSSLTSSSAEVFFSYQPASMEPFIRPEPVDRFASYHAHLPIADGEPASPASMASPAIASSSVATSPSSYSSAMPSPLTESPSPFEASLSLPVHRTQTGQMMHTQTLLSSTHLPLPQHYSSLVSTSQPFRQLPTLPSVNPPLTIHPYPSLPHRSLLNPSSQTPPLPIPTTSISTHVPLPPIAAAMNGAQPSVSGTSSQGDKEMSPDSMEIFISHLLTDKSGEVMTLRPM